jgi:hypothetical protein
MPHEARYTSHMKGRHLYAQMPEGDCQFIRIYLTAAVSVNEPEDKISYGPGNPGISVMVAAAAAACTR